MARTLTAFLLSSSLALAGCTALRSAPLPLKQVEAEGDYDFYQVKLQVILSALRQVQTLPTTWDHVKLTVESNRLKAPAMLDVTTSTATVSVEMRLPPGDATISALLTNAGLFVATGSSTASLQLGTNNVHINLQTLLDFSGNVLGS